MINFPTGFKRLEIIQTQAPMVFVSVLVRGQILGLHATFIVPPGNVISSLSQLPVVQKEIP